MAEPAPVMQATGGIKPASWVDIGVGDQIMEAYLTTPGADGPHPAVVVIQEIWA
jgi:dienelactone hydrolase